MLYNLIRCSSVFGKEYPVARLKTNTSMPPFGNYVPVRNFTLILPRSPAAPFNQG